MKRSTRLGFGSVTSVALLLGVGVAVGGPASAHGYVEGPFSRSAACAMGLNSDCGGLVYEPQSLEAPKGFPEAGPADGQIASAGGLFGGNLDQQSESRWYKNDVSAGPLLIDWRYTAPHSTAKWHYYMTKPGWDQNAPLDRGDFEKIAEVQHDGSKASTNPDHTIVIPENRSGYHVILAVWDIADTVNAFYNVIDVNVVGNDQALTEPVPVEEAPVEEAPVEEAPVEEAPVEEAPVEEAPVEEAPVKEAPVEEAPVEEAPVADGTWNPVGSYAAGDEVTFGGQTYRAVQSHTGNGDPNWIYAPSLWQVVTAQEPVAEESATPTWNPVGSYAAGDEVTFGGQTYRAVQSHTGNGDPNWIYAPSLWATI